MITHQPLQFKSHVAVVDFRSEKIKTQILPPWIRPDSYLIWGRIFMNLPDFGSCEHFLNYVIYTPGSDSDDH